MRVERIEGSPDRKHVSTSFVERQNLTMRMGMRIMRARCRAGDRRARRLASRWSREGRSPEMVSAARGRCKLLIPAALGVEHEQRTTV
jgi:hypothetical protein